MPYVQTQGPLYLARTGSANTARWLADICITGLFHAHTKGLPKEIELDGKNPLGRRKIEEMPSQSVVMLCCKHRAQQYSANLYLLGIVGK
jgi:hypothetical protein